MKLFQKAGPYKIRGGNVKWPVSLAFSLYWKGGEMVGRIFFFYRDKKKEQINNSVNSFFNPTTEDLKAQSLQSLETLTWNLSTVTTNSLGVYKLSWLMLCFTIFSHLLFYNCSEECGEKRGSTIIKLTGVRICSSQSPILLCPDAVSHFPPQCPSTRFKYLSAVSQTPETANGSHSWPSSEWP